jgi:IPT/TIG domain/S-layer homology domain
MKTIRCLPAVLVFFAFLVLTPPASAFTTFVVTNTNDAGPGSLRQAILDSNATMDVNTIDFAIPGTGVQTIVALSPLPLISQPVAIDGYSQPGASANTAPPGSGFNSVLLIQVTGSPILVDAGNSGVFPAMVVSGLVVDEIQCGLQSDGAIIFGNYVGTDASGSVSNGGRIIVVSATGVHIGPGNVTFGISVGPGGNGTLISGNFIGINAAGNAALADSATGAGIQVSDSTAVIIGGATPADRNVIDSAHTGVDAGDGADQIQILGNYIGTDASGTKPIGNLIGVSVETGDGTSATVKGNVISGNSDGIEVADVGESLFAVIQGNFIGTDETATLDLGNADFGILVAANSVLIGGTGPGEGNVIAFNQNRILSFAALEVTGSLVTIRGNRIFNSTFLGLDLADPVLGAEVITVNDPGDVDTGPNGLQNFPLITSIVPGSSTTHIDGRLNSMPTSAYSIDLFSNPACVRRPRAPLEAETYLGTVDVATDGFGNATFSVDVPVVLSPGQVVTATATDSLGNTSELSQRIVFTVSPLAGPAGQTTDVTIKGMEFETGATVTVGGVPATNVTATSPTTITATMPAFPAGTLHDLTVSTPSGLSSTLPNGWMTDFSDMPDTTLFHDFVVRLVTNGVATGVGGGNYGAQSPTLREQMAVFLLKGRHGACYAPPPCSGVFADVPCSNPFAPWIEALAQEGITAGCGGGNFCPTQPVLREQMAVFLLKAEHGASYVPPPCGSFFTDVPCPSQYANWISRLLNEQITGGCGDHLFCPLDPVLRQQMAVFVVKTLLLP